MIVINNEFNLLSDIRSGEIIAREQAMQRGTPAVIHQPSMSLSWQGRAARKLLVLCLHLIARV